MYTKESNTNNSHLKIIFLGIIFRYYFLALQEDGFGSEKYFKCFVADRQENGIYGYIKLHVFPWKYGRLLIIR